MDYCLYSVYDKTADEYGPVFQAVNDGVAKREYNRLGIPESLKKEYSLHKIGYFDSKTGDVVPEVNYIVETSEAVNE